MNLFAFLLSNFYGAKLWDLSLSANGIFIYTISVTMRDRATLGSDPSTIVMLYGIANILVGVGFFYLLENVLWTEQFE